MNGIDTIQFADIARQRMQQDAAAAREYTRRRPQRARTEPDGARSHTWRLHWRPARAGVVGP